jgi:hypothetical protein
VSLRPRFSLRTLLVVVTVFALIIAQLSRVIRLNRLADQHHHKKLVSGFSILKYTRRHHQDVIDRLKLATEYHARMEDSQSTEAPSLVPLLTANDVRAGDVVVWDFGLA